MRHLHPIALIVAVAASEPSAVAADKNGVAPQAISLPSGPGSIQGLGESFQPQLNSGTGSYAVPLALPRGTGGITPEMTLVYNSGGGNGVLGLGWRLSGAVTVVRNTDHGMPLYVDGPNGQDDDLDGRIDNPEEPDTYTGIGGEELVALADGTFRAETEEAFVRYRRLGSGWEAHSRDGARFVFGQGAGARVEEGGKTFEWLLERREDRNGNAIEYDYLPDPASPAQKHLRRIRWGQPGAYLAAVLSYEEGRPDVFTSFRSGFELVTSLRLVRIDVVSQGIPAAAEAVRSDFDGDGKVDALIRRWRLEYDPESHLSLLARVTQIGRDGVTALPAWSASYSRWTPVDDASAALVRSVGAPTAGFDSGSIELIDMNGDALPDLLSTTASQHRVFMNRGLGADGRLAWGPGQPVGNAPSIDIISERTHLADSTADGASDLLVKVSNTVFQAYDNTSQGSWKSPVAPLGNTDTWPIWPFEGTEGARSRSIDCDYSRTNDILYTSDSGLRLWMLLDDNRYSLEVRLPPLTFEGSVFRFDLPGTAIADLNGDRQQDLVWIQASRVVWFPSHGRGRFGTPEVLGLGRTLSASDISKSGFSDVDGDGLVDLTTVRPDSDPNALLYWLNRFQRGLDGPRAVRGLPPQRTGDALRWADMNGNGTTDIVISQAQSAPGEKVLTIDLVPSGKVNLLERIDNGLGLVVTLDYESSVAQMVRAEAQGQPWSTVMPVPISVVSRIVADDGVSPPFDQVISYRDPHYESAKQEFRGFAGADLQETGDASVATKITRHVFDTGRAEMCLKGKTLSEAVLGEDGTVFVRSVNTWGARVLASGLDGRDVCFPATEAVDRTVLEGQAAGVALRDEMVYDDFGHVVVERRLGVADAAGDEIVTEREYDVRIDPWLLDLLASERTLDGAGSILAEKRHAYDARGNLERTDLWLAEEGRFVPALRQRFDVFGNVIEKTDARGSRRSIAHDPLIHAWPVEETQHLAGGDLTMTADYDLGLGVVTEATDFSGDESRYAYDALGRLVERQRSGGAVETYEYRLGAPVSRIIKRGRENAGGDTLDSHTYYDGQGRELITKLEAEGGKWRVADAKRFNARKLEAARWIGYLSATPEYEAPDPARPHHSMSYDVLGRLLETLAPDGSRTRTEYLPLERRQLDGTDLEAGGSPNVLRSDGLDRLVQVEERNGAETYVTRYAWNVRGELTSIVDAQGNTKRFRFDSMSRLVEVDDPDRGLLRTTFDDAGNATERLDARGRKVAMTYDEADRPLEKIHRGAGADGADIVETRWHYDEPAGVLDFGDGSSGAARNTGARLAWAEDRTGETHYSYDERGNVEWVLKRVRDEATGLLVPFRTQRRHDLLDREVEIVFPDNDLLRFDHGPGSFVTSIRGDGAGAGTILAEAEYSGSGRPFRLLWGNGVESLFEYDENDRLEAERLLVADGTALRHERLEYDAVSNIVAIDDLRPTAAVPADSPRRTTARFDYDELHRLGRASYGAGGSLGIVNYAYDALGNLLEQTTPPLGQPGHIGDPRVRLGAVSYAGGRTGRSGRRPGDPPGPHALTGSAGGLALSYDADGNVVRHGEAELTWDHEDRIEAFDGPDSSATYAYDHSGRRAVRRVRRGSAVEEIWHVDPACEVRGAGTVVKYAFLDGRRVARIEGRLGPSRDAVQVVRLASGWNLVSAAVETAASLRDAFGADAAVWGASGASYAPVSLATAVPPGRALWVHVPTARVASLRGAPRSSAGGVVSPGPLHAWPSLDAFRPARDLEGAPPLMVFDAGARRWLRRDPALPAFLSEAPPELGSAQAFWSGGDVRFRSATSRPASIVFYHADAVDSVAAMTDEGGALVEERARYPFGAIRNIHRPGGPLAGSDHDFTGHERDSESGLVHMGARSYLDLAGVFLSPDPLYVAAAALGGDDGGKLAEFLANPQMGNLYAHALRQPLKYVDPDGLEVVFSKSVSSDPNFKYAWKAFVATQRGQRVLKSLEHAKGRVYITDGKVRGPKVTGKGIGTMMAKVFGPTSKLDVNVEDRMAVVTIDLAQHAKRSGLFGPSGTMDNIARDIHRELRKVQVHIGVSEMFKSGAEALDAAGKATDPAKQMQHLENAGGWFEWGAEKLGYIADPSSDPANKEFDRQLHEDQRPK